MNRLNHVTLAFAIAFAGCDRWDNADAVWTIEVSAFDPYGPSLIPASTAPDGTTLVAVADVRFGDQDLTGPHLVRIGRDGAIIAISAVSEIESDRAMAIRVDAEGRPVAAFASATGYTIVAFDENLASRWSADPSPDILTAWGTPLQGVFDVGPAGQVAFGAQNPGYSQTLHYLGDDGIERWAAATSGVVSYDHIVIMANGDLIAHGDGRRVRFGASDGQILDDLEVPLVDAVNRDGLSVARTLTDGRAQEVTLRDADGVVRWRRSVEGIGYCGFECGYWEGSPGAGLVAISPGGDVLLKVYQQQQVRLDAETGDRIGDVEHCGDPKIVDIDDSGYLAIGPICDSGPGLARYPLP